MMQLCLGPVGVMSPNFVKHCFNTCPSKLYKIT